METNNILAEDIVKAFSEQFHSPRRSFKNTIHSIAKLRTTPFPMDRIPFTDNKYKVILSELLKNPNEIAFQKAKKEMDAVDAFNEYWKNCFLNSNVKQIPRSFKIYQNIVLVEDKELDNDKIRITTKY